MRLEYTGPQVDGIDVPSLNIENWKPGETRDVPEEIGQEWLQHRPDEFRRPEGIKAEAAKPAPQAAPHKHS